MSTETVEPLGDAVLVLPDPDSSKSEGGIALTHDTRRIGKGGVVIRKGAGVTLELEEGERVIFAGERGKSGYVGRPTDIDGVRHLVIDQVDLLYVVGVDEGA